MNNKKFVLINVTQETRKQMTENQLLEMGVDEFIIDDAYDNEEITFYQDGEEFILENPRFYDTVAKMKGI
jgi:hypothetical protein|tara:strand:- start:256 stop:465 length:210 start_codon:yes stop_codon:yes gene_type:complete